MKTIVKHNNLLKPLLTLLLFFSVSLIWGQEELVNGNFESWDDSTTPSGWTHIENTTQESTEIHGGTFSAKHVGGTKDLGQLITGISPNESYNLTVWYKVDSGDSTSARIWSYWKNDSGTNIDNNDYDTEDAIRGPDNGYFDNNGNVWTEYTVTITSPTDASQFYFEVRTYSGATVYWDDFSLFKNSSTPTITTSPTSLTGFTYVETNGPSAEQSFTVEGSNLTDDISLTPPTNWEISTTSGSGYQTSAITLTQSGGSVASTTIYTRMVSGLTNANSPFSGDIACTTDDGGTAVTENVAVDGTVDPNVPEIQIQMPSETDVACGYNYDFGSQNNGTSTNQTLRVKNTGTTDLNITSYPLSGTDAGEFSLSPASTSATVTAGGYYDITVTFSPTSAGSKTAKITINNDDDDEGTCEINLAGISVPPCAEPNQATALNFPNTTATSIELSWTAASGDADNYLVVQSTSAISPSPVDGTDYPVDNTDLGGTVVFNASGTSFTDSDLSTNTQYYYYVFAYNNTDCSGGPDYNTTFLDGDETTLDGPCLTEDFDSFTSGAPSGWTGTGCSNYDSDSSSGVSPNSAKFDDTDDELITPDLNGNARSLSFWLKGNSTDASSAFLIEGYDGTSWVTIENITNSIPTSETTYLYDASSTPALPANISKFRFTYTKSAGNVAFDDVEVYCGAATSEIEIQGNATEIVNGDTTPDTADDTDFGNIEESGATEAHTFTIKNTGGADLTINSVTSDNSSEFAVSGTTSGTITAGNEITFTVSFDPSTLGERTATITVDNDDADEATYTFDIKGNGTGSVESDIITNDSEAVTISSIENDASIDTTSDGVEVWQFTIRDGGADLTDNDNEATKLTAITFTQGNGNAIDDWNDAILACALFEGTTKIADASAIITNQIQFSGLSFDVPDDSAKTLSLRISIQPSPNNTGGNLDGDDFQFQISQANVTADSNGSQFDSFLAIKSENGKNVLDVVATQLVFAVQPVNIGENSTMTPAPQVVAKDINGNIDFDYSGDISITSSGTMTGDPITETSVNGVSTFSNVVHTATGTDITITASAPGFSDVASSTFDVFQQTILYQGDLAILAVNSNIGSGEDQIAFVCFKDINPGTKIYLTDNGYEREFANEWGGTEGVIAITRTNSVLTKGTIIVFESNNGNVTSSSHYDIYTCGVVDTNWTKEALSGSNIGGFNLNSDDDMWIMQGGTWTNDTDHHSTYDGNVLYGWTESGWNTGVGDGTDGTKWSNLYPKSKCFSTIAPSGDGKVKFNDPVDPDFSTTDNDQLDWVSLINTTGNWDTYSDNAGYNSGGFDYKGDTNCPQITIATSTHIAGKWQGDTDNNWFDCSNWDNLTVPTASTDVNIPTGATTDVSIDASASDSDLYNDIAYAHNLTLQSGRTLTMTNIADVLLVSGNWDNQVGESAFVEGQGIVKFVGSALQTLTCNTTETEKFYNLTIDNAAGVSFASGDIYVANDLGILSNTPMTVADGHYAYIGHNLVNNAAIIIENQGALVQADDAGTITGTGTFKLDKTSLSLDNYYDYVYWSSPINSNTFTLGDIVTDAWGYFKFDPAQAGNGHTFPGWVMMSSTDQLTNGMGYAISAPTGAAANTILSPSFIKDHDPFNNGEISISVLRKGGPDDIGNFNLVGNPYPSAIDFHALANDADNANVAANYSLWTNCEGLDVSGHHQASGYATYSYSGGNGTAVAACSGNGGTAEAGQYIATGQGFMIEATADDSTLKFKNAFRVTNHNDGFLNRPTTQQNIVWLDMTDANAGFSQIAVGFYNDATNNYERLFDAHSMNTGSGFALYSLVGNDKLSIQGLAGLDATERVVPLGVESDVARNINIHLNRTEGLESEYIYLHDMYLNILHDMKATDYVTTVNTTENDRFELIFSSTAMDVNENILNPNAVSLIQNEGKFTLQSNNDKNMTAVYVYDLSGRLLFAQNDINSQSLQMNLKYIATGNMLLFRIQMQDNAFVIKKAIKQ